MNINRMIAPLTSQELGAIDFGVILTKVKCKALDMDDICMSLGMERKKSRVKQP